MQDLAHGVKRNFFSDALPGSGQLYPDMSRCSLAKNGVQVMIFYYIHFMRISVRGKISGILQYTRFPKTCLASAIYTDRVVLHPIWP